MKIYFRYLVVLILILAGINVAIVRPTSEIRYRDFAGRFSETYFKRLDHPDMYPIQNIEKSIRFDKEDQYIRVTLRILYVGGIIYSLKCRVFRDMLAKCYIGIMGISFELPDSRSFYYRWR